MHEIRALARRNYFAKLLFSSWLRRGGTIGGPRKSFPFDMIQPSYSARAAFNQVARRTTLLDTCRTFVSIDAADRYDIRIVGSAIMDSCIFSVSIPVVGCSISRQMLAHCCFLATFLVQERMSRLDRANDVNYAFSYDFSSDT